MTEGDAGGDATGAHATGMDATGMDATGMDATGIDSASGDGGAGGVDGGLLELPVRRTKDQRMADALAILLLGADETTPARPVKPKVLVQVTVDLPTLVHLRNTPVSCSATGRSPPRSPASSPATPPGNGSSTNPSPATCSTPATSATNPRRRSPGSG